MYFTKKDQIAPYLTMTVAMGLGALLTAKTISKHTVARNLYRMYICMHDYVYIYVLH